ncbi:transposase domain-containing protein [Burkholderia mayonis]|uniref:transposase domain-containing protein n=1 Tax=Burkholderia mayonis TaxID=1385591 RepID=UPI003AAFEEF5
MTCKPNGIEPYRYLVWLFARYRSPQPPTTARRSCHGTYSPICVGPLSPVGSPEHPRSTMTTQPQVVIVGDARHPSTGR